MKIEVGTVIYVIDSGQKVVLPARVNEQIITKKINEERTTHKIEFPNGKTAVLEKLDVLHFLNVQEVQQHLMSRAQKIIDEGILHAQRIAAEKFEAAAPVDLPFQDADAKDSRMQVTLPDGKTANVNFNIPPEFIDENPGG